MGLPPSEPAMQRRLVIATAPALLLLRPAWALNLSEGDANAGIRTALERGANAAVALLGRPDGFLGRAGRSAGSRGARHRPHVASGREASGMRPCVLYALPRPGH